MNASGSCASPSVCLHCSCRRKSWTGDRVTASLGLLLLPSSTSALLSAARDRLLSPPLNLSFPLSAVLSDSRSAPGRHTLHPRCWASASLQLHSVHTSGHCSYSSSAKRSPALSLIEALEVRHPPRNVIRTPATRRTWRWCFRCDQMRECESLSQPSCRCRST